MPWVFDPQSGGVKIPATAQERIRKRINDHAAKHYAGKYTRLDIRFKGVFYYIDAYKEPSVPKGWPPRGLETGETREQIIERLRSTPTHLVRLRHFTEDRWSAAFYTYSHERYEPCLFHDGGWFGTPEAGFDIGAGYLTGD